jgi:hypothetical protein
MRQSVIKFLLKKHGSNCYYSLVYAYTTTAQIILCPFNRGAIALEVSFNSFPIPPDSPPRGFAHFAL